MRITPVLNIPTQHSSTTCTITDATASTVTFLYSPPTPIPRSISSPPNDTLPTTGGHILNPNLAEQPDAVVQEINDVLASDRQRLADFNSDISSNLQRAAESIRTSFPRELMFPSEEATNTHSLPDVSEETLNQPTSIPRIVMPHIVPTILNHAFNLQEVDQSLIDRSRIELFNAAANLHSIGTQEITPIVSSTFTTVLDNNANISEEARSDFRSIAQEARDRHRSGIELRSSMLTTVTLATSGAIIFWANRFGYLDFGLIASRGLSWFANYIFNSHPSTRSPSTANTSIIEPQPTTSTEGPITETPFINDPSSITDPTNWGPKPH